MAKLGWFLEEGGNFVWEEAEGGERGERDPGEERGGMPRPGLGRHWSLSTAVTPAHTRSTVGWDLLKCK